MVCIQPGCLQTGRGVPRRCDVGVFSRARLAPRVQGRGVTREIPVFAFLSAAPRVLFVRGQAAGASGGGAAGAVPQRPTRRHSRSRTPAALPPQPPVFVLLLEPTFLRNLMVIPCLQFTPSDGHLKNTL